MFNYWMEAGQIAVFLTMVGLYVRTMSKVSSNGRDIHNISLNMARVEKDIEQERKVREAERRERDADNLSLWKEIAGMKSSLTEAITLLKANIEYTKETLSKHEVLLNRLIK